MSAKHLHLHEIPSKIVRKGSDASNYRNDLIRTMIGVQYTNQQVQYSAQISTFNLRQLPKPTGGYLPRRKDVFGSIEEFVYHYENFCYRVFSLREKTLLFINAALKVGYEERDVSIKNIKINPTVKSAKLISTIARFETNKPTSLGSIIIDRNRLTHKLYYGQLADHYMRPQDIPADETPETMKEWFRSWKGEIDTKAKQADKASNQLFGLNHEHSEKITAFMTK